MFEEKDFLKRSQLIEIFIALVVLELFLFSDVLMPFQWGRIKISGQLHSGPNAELISGKFYLKCSMHDSLKIKKLDLSQIQLINPPSSKYDPMGVDEYIVRGKITGTFKETSNSKIYLLFKVDSNTPINPIKKYIVLTLFYLQMAIFTRYILIKSSDSNTQTL